MENELIACEKQIKLNFKALEKHLERDFPKLLFSPKEERKKFLEDTLEAKERWKSLKLENAEVLIVYGLGFGSFYGEAEKWLLEKNHYLAFIEDDVKSLKNFCSTAFSKKLLKDAKVKIFFLKNHEEKEHLLKKIAWEYLFLKFQFSAHLSYAAKKSYPELCLHLKGLQRGVNLVASGYSDFGCRHFENIYFNFLNTEKLKIGSQLSFKKVPAIICGAGPSFEKNSSVLKKMTDKALIFAGGSALNVISEIGLEPHFIGSVDKDAPYERFKLHSLFETPFFYQPSFSKENLSLVHGPLLLMGDALSYPFQSWFFKELGINLDLCKGGWNVATFLAKTAFILGCDPIVFVGMDLCFSEKRYAKGVKTVSDKEKGYELVESKDIYGNKVFTQKDWLLAKDWIEEIAKNSQTLFINASEGGILKNIINQPLKEVGEEFFQKSFDLKGLCHQAVENVETQEIDKKSVIALLTKIYKSFMSSQLILKGCLNEFEKDLSYPELRKKLFLNELQLLKEPVFRYLLEPLWSIWQFVFKKQLLDDQNPMPFEFKLALNKILFLLKAIEEHLAVLNKVEEIKCLHTK